MFTKRAENVESHEPTKRRKLIDAKVTGTNASISDNYNRFPLHKLCSAKDTPIHLLREVYESYPEAALTIDNFGYTPILYAVEKGFEKAVFFLANACPRCIILCDGRQSSPIQTAIEYEHPNSMIKSLLNAFPEAAFIPDAQQESAFHDFFRIWNIFIRVKLLENPDISFRSKAMFKRDDTHKWSVGDIYKNLSLLLMASSYIPNEDLKSWKILHTALKFGSCHWSFSKLLLQLHPEQCLQKDADGNLPLHIITAASETTDEESFTCVDCGGNIQDLVHFQSESGLSNNCCSMCFAEESEKIIASYPMKPIRKVSKITTDLLKVAPEATAITNRNGKLALHIAIESKQSFKVINKLLNAYPLACEKVEPESKLLPFMLAAEGEWKNEVDQISTVYQLLVEDPILIFKK